MCVLSTLRESKTFSQVMSEAEKENKSSLSPEGEGEGAEEGEGMREEELVITLPDGATLRKRVIREGSYQPQPREGDGCILTYQCNRSLGNHDEGLTKLPVVQDRVRVVLASSRHFDLTAAATTDTYTLAHSAPDSPGSPPNFARPPAHLDALLRSMRPFERCAFTLSPPPPQPLPPPPAAASAAAGATAPASLPLNVYMTAATAVIAAASSAVPDINTMTASGATVASSSAAFPETVVAAGEVELHCVLGGVCQLALPTTGFGSQRKLSTSSSSSNVGGAVDDGECGVTVRVISRSTAPEDRYPARIKGDSRVRLMVVEAPNVGCCGGCSRGEEGVRYEAVAGASAPAAAVVEECVEFNVGDGTAMEGLETAALLGSGDGNGLQMGDVALVTIRGEYTLPDIPAEIPEELLPKRLKIIGASTFSPLSECNRNSGDDGQDDVDQLAKEVFHLQVRVASVGAARKGKIAMSAVERVAWGAELQAMGTALFRAGRLRRAEVDTRPMIPSPKP